MSSEINIEAKLSPWINHIRIQEYSSIVFSKVYHNNKIVIIIQNYSTIEGKIQQSKLYGHIQGKKF